MTEQKTKLVCVGWGILITPKSLGGKPADKRYMCFEGVNKNSEEEAITGHDVFCSEHAPYIELKQQGLAIAKKLWVEVKDA